MKRMDPLLHVAMVVYPEHPASKVVSAFLCLGALNTALPDPLFSAAVRHDRVAAPTDRLTRARPVSHRHYISPLLVGCFGEYTLQPGKRLTELKHLSLYSSLMVRTPFLQNTSPLGVLSCVKLSAIHVRNQG